MDICATEDAGKVNDSLFSEERIMLALKVVNVVHVHLYGGMAGINLDIVKVDVRIPELTNGNRVAKMVGGSATLSGEVVDF